MNKPKILFVDIETAPNLGYIWGKYQQDVIEFKSRWYMLSFSARWMNGKYITKGLIDYPSFNKDRENDKLLIEDLWELFNEADVLVAHNGDKFDIKKSNARFTIHRLLPPAPYKTVDTLKVARKHFAFASNKLDDLGKVLGIGHKVHTGGFKLWRDCMEGDPKAWRRMKKYNRQDVVLLEKVYFRLLPWMSHPSVFFGRVCPNCGSNHLQARGYARTPASEFRRFHCQDCGRWCRTPIRERAVTTYRNIT